jgi:uncharacterized BrkB/YihY/UPF0761 family membrane protein
LTCSMSFLMPLLCISTSLIILLIKCFPPRLLDVFQNIHDVPQHPMSSSFNILSSTVIIHCYLLVFFFVLPSSFDTRKKAIFGGHLACFLVSLHASSCPRHHPRYFLTPTMTLNVLPSALNVSHYAS